MTKIKVTCDNCGKAIERYPSGIARAKRHFCNPKCHGEWQKKHKCGKDNHHWKGGLEKRICEYCGKEFSEKLSRIREGRGKFCSHTCHSAWRKGRKVDYELTEEGRRKKIESRKQQKFPQHHTKPEMIFEIICKKYNLPFKYTGDGSFWIHNINPDFVECNGKKIAVEIFGEYWHSPLLHRGLGEDRTLKYRKRILKKYGWKLTVFWDADLLREDAEAFVFKKLKKEKRI